jgi:hypothetical protein
MQTESLSFGISKGDGNCYYRSILQVAGLDPEQHYDLRRAVCKYAKDNHHKYKRFFDGSDPTKSMGEYQKRQSMVNVEIEGILVEVPSDCF